MSSDATPRIVVYTRRYCGYCDRARRLLRERGIPFAEIDVSDDHDTRDRIVDETGHTTLPVVLLDGQLIGGSDELAMLDRSGGLATLLNK
jgi:glutaredoxin 3